MAINLLRKTIDGREVVVNYRTDGTIQWVYYLCDYKYEMGQAEDRKEKGSAPECEVSLELLAQHQAENRMSSNILELV